MDRKSIADVVGFFSLTNTPFPNKCTFNWNRKVYSQFLKCSLLKIKFDLYMSWYWCWYVFSTCYSNHYKLFMKITFQEVNWVSLPWVRNFRDLTDITFYFTWITSSDFFKCHGAKIRLSNIVWINEIILWLGVFLKFFITYINNKVKYYIWCILWRHMNFNVKWRA